MRTTISAYAAGLLFFLATGVSGGELFEDTLVVKVEKGLRGPACMWPASASTGFTGNEFLHELFQKMGIIAGERGSHLLE